MANAFIKKYNGYFFHSMLSLILLLKKSVHRQFSYSKEGYRDMTLVLLKSKSIHHYLEVATNSACWEPRRVCDNSVANSSFI
jgi:hypothetical protein